MRSDSIIHLNFALHPLHLFCLNAKIVICEGKALIEVYHLAYSEPASEQPPWDHVARCVELPG